MFLEEWLRRATYSVSASMLRCLILLGVAVDAYSQEMPPLSILDERPAVSSNSLLSDSIAQYACRKTLSKGEAISLDEAIHKALCNNPATRQSWYSMLTQAAQVGLAKSAYLPNIGISGQLDRVASTTNVGGTAYVDNIVDRSTSINLAWVLYDSGLRRANLESARQALNSANATYFAALQTVIVGTAQAYYATWASDRSLLAAKEAEHFAEENYIAAKFKHQLGAGTLTDELQAQTAYAQAKVNRIEAEGVVNVAQGALAVVMGFSPNVRFVTQYSLVDASNAETSRSVDDLLEIGRHDNPTLKAAEALWRANEAKIDSAIAAGGPTLSLYGSSTRNPMLSQTSGEVIRTKSRTIGIQLNIPIFEGFARGSTVKNARFSADASRAAMENTALQVGLEIWTSFQNLRTQSENLEASNILKNSAAYAYEIALKRYRAGVGKILDVLSSQSILADAEQKLIKARTALLMGRLQLAASIGHLENLPEFSGK